MPFAPCAAPAMTVVRPDEETLSRQCLPYFVGVSGVSTPATGISMNLVIIPPHGSPNRTSTAGSRRRST